MFGKDGLIQAIEESQGQPLQQSLSSILECAQEWTAGGFRDGRGRGKRSPHSSLPTSVPLPTQTCFKVEVFGKDGLIQAIEESQGQPLQQSLSSILECAQEWSCDTKVEDDISPWRWKWVSDCGSGRTGLQRHRRHTQSRNSRAEH